MSEGTKIEWAHHTHNLWWGCVKLSQACARCYAETLAKRYGYHVWGEHSPRRFFGPKHYLEPVKWNREALAAGERRRVFCMSMGDLFERLGGPVGELQDLHREWLWTLVGLTPMLDWMLLTKRPENVLEMVSDSWRYDWPPNAWLGCTFDDDGPRRLDVLCDLPARTIFTSIEPLLGPVTLTDVWLAFLDLVIVGAESGGKARPMREEWVRDIRDQCTRAGVNFFYKQKLDARGHKVSLPLLDGRQWSEMPS